MERGTPTPVFPARCALCGGESTASGWSRTITAIGGEALLWGSIIFALTIGSLYGLLALPFGMIVLATAVNRSFPLIAIDAGLAKARRRAIQHFWIAVAVAVAVVAVRRFA